LHCFGFLVFFVCFGFRYSNFEFDFIVGAFIMTPRTKERFLDPATLARLGSMKLRAETLVEGVLGGLHQSPYRGYSIEFAEYRRYQPGDDPRRIDWKVLARSDHYCIKECEDETNLDAVLALDASASMDFGTGAMTKWQYGATLTAALAYVLQRQNDNVGLVVLDEQIRIQTEPTNARGRLMETIGRLERHRPEGRTALAKALHEVAGRVRRRGMAIVISDLLDEPEDVISALAHLRFAGNDVIVFHLLDPAELRLDHDGPTHFIDPENGATVPALVADVRAAYLERLGRFLERYSEALGQMNVTYERLDVSQPLDRALLAFLGRRAAA
jgi:uncharacterized protein (DUF58 family)